MSRPPRLKEFSYIGQYQYFLTFCTFERRRALTDAETVEMVITQFRQCSEVDGIAVEAYCAMPDHVHLLVTGLTATSDVRHFVERSKQRTAWTFKDRTGERLWQEGYYDHVLREKDDVAGVIAYIVNNPIRAKLVESPGDYLFWGSMTHDRQAILELIADIPDWKLPR